LRSRLQNIALKEMARRRRSLGKMTSEQEHALEELLVSTIEKVSKPIFDKVQEFRVAGEVEKAFAWCSIFD
jgi:hypothetical protein